jgi:uncharacterized protein
MKVCSKCQRKNQESSRFCKKCGFQLSNSSFQDKKEKVLGEKKGKPYWVPVSLAIIVIALAGIGYWIIQGESTAANPGISAQPKVSGKVDYTGQKIQMADIQAKVEKGKISIPLSEVMEKKMVRFEYQAKGVSVPLLSYVTQSGRIITAVSMCEPCKSTRFHIKDKTLVCNACYTEWDLENLKGIKGGCLNYPPDVIPSTIEQDRIIIDEKVVLGWKPRV